jgi:hypothetical protein
VNKEVNIINDKNHKKSVADRPCDHLGLEISYNENDANGGKYLEFHMTI